MRGSNQMRTLVIAFERSHKMSEKTHNIFLKMK